MNTKSASLSIMLLFCPAVMGQTGFSDEMKLVFSDDFERDETQLEKDEVGNGWTTNGDKPWASSPKQTDLRDGALYIEPAKDDGAAVLIIRKWEFHDGAIQFRFNLPSKKDSVGLVFANSKLKDVHAGHVMVVLMKPGSVKMTDMLKGSFDPQIWKRRKAGMTTEADKKQIKKCTTTVGANISSGMWHEVAISIRSDQVSVKLDGRQVGSFKSPGIAHRKDTLRVTFRGNGVLDDFKLFERLGDEG